MIDLHTHTYFSDGSLGPAELARRALVAGYRVVGLSDHADATNLEDCVGKAVKAVASLNGNMGDFRFLAGVELTHVPPPLIADMIKKAKDLGATYVIVHGETIAEPVAPGTNRAAILGGADILAHPGLIRADDMALATENKVYIELTTHDRHSITNGHVAKLAQSEGALLILNNDAHNPEDFIGLDRAEKVIMGAGLSADDFKDIRKNAYDFVERFLV